MYGTPNELSVHPPARRKDVCPGALGAVDGNRPSVRRAWHGMGHGSIGNYLVLVAVGGTGTKASERETERESHRTRLTGKF